MLKDITNCVEFPVHFFPIVHLYKIRPSTTHIIAENPNRIPVFMPVDKNHSSRELYMTVASSNKYGIPGVSNSVTPTIHQKLHSSAPNPMAIPVSTKDIQVVFFVKTYGSATMAILKHTIKACIACPKMRRAVKREIAIKPPLLCFIKNPRTTRNNHGENR